jgi:putative hydrolase of the HAD superfamily
MPGNRIKAVLFDLGETLLDFGRVNATRLFREGARLSYGFLKELGQPVGNFTCYFWRNLLRLRMRHLLSNLTGRDFDALALLRSIGKGKGISLSTEQWNHLAWLWYEPLSRLGRTEPGTRETLTALEGLGLKLGIVSNTFVNSYSLERHLQQLGILDFFAVRIYSYEFDFRKPDARIFLAAAERIGETSENILYVGDRIDKDIRPAIRAGMHAVLKDAYTNAGKKLPPGARRIGRLAELPDLVRTINAEVPIGCR